MRLPPLALAALAALPTSRSMHFAGPPTAPLAPPPSSAALLPLDEHTAAPAPRMRHALAPVEHVRDLDSVARSREVGEAQLGGVASAGELDRAMRKEQVSYAPVAAATSVPTRRPRSTSSTSRRSPSPSPASPCSTATAPPSPQQTALPARALLSAPLPGRTLAVRPVGLVFTSALLGVLLAVTAYMAYERLLYRRQFRARRAADMARRAGERDRTWAAQGTEMSALEGGGRGGR